MGARRPPPRLTRLPRPRPPRPHLRAPPARAGDGDQARSPHGTAAVHGGAHPRERDVDALVGRPIPCPVSLAWSYYVVRSAPRGGPLSERVTHRAVCRP